MNHLSAPELAAWLADAARPDATRAAPLLLDVRETWEWDKCHLAGATHVPMREIPARVAEFTSAGRPLVCICHHGARSMQVAMFLQHAGVADLYNLTGGIDAWSRQVDPACPTY